MWWYLIGSILAVWGVWSIQRTQRLYQKYDAKLKEMQDQTKRGYYPQVEIDRIMAEEIEAFKEKHLDATMLIQMADGIKSGAVDMVGVEVEEGDTAGIVMLSQEEYERLVHCDNLVTSMNEAAQKKEMAN